MKLSVSEELRGNRLSLIRAVILSSSGVPVVVTVRCQNKSTTPIGLMKRSYVCFGSMN